MDVQGGRHPFLPAGNRLRTGFPAFTSEGSQSLRAFQTAQRPLRLCRGLSDCAERHASAKGGGGSPRCFGTCWAPLARRQSPFCLRQCIYQKELAFAPKIMLFGNPLPPGGGDYLALARTSTLSQGIPIKSLPPTPPHRAHRYPCCA